MVANPKEITWPYHSLEEYFAIEGAGHVRYEYWDGQILCIETLSPSTESRDRGPKRAAYQALPSLMEYLLVAQDAPHVTHYLRQGNDWVRSDYGSLDLSVVLPSIECTLALSELYKDVEFP